MFTAFLVGTLVVSTLVLLGLLAVPERRNGGGLPFVDVALAVAFMALAFLGGMVIAG